MFRLNVAFAVLSLLLPVASLTPASERRRDAPADGALGSVKGGIAAELEYGYMLRQVPQQPQPAVEKETKPAFIYDAMFVARVMGYGTFGGFVHGLTGAGGCIVLMPVLYYAFEVTPFKRAVFCAYLIVAIISAYGTYSGVSKGNVVWKDVLLCALFVSGLGCMMGAYCAYLVSDATQLLFFAFSVVSAAGYTLWKSQQSAPAPPPGCCLGAPIAEDKGAAPMQPAEKTWGQLCGTAALAVSIGFLCGLVGIGGGFMLVPLLISMGHEMDTAVPTTQGVVTASATMGCFYYGYLNSYDHQDLEVVLLAGLFFFAMLGMVVAQLAADGMTQKTRQQVFAGLLISLGTFVVASNPIVYNTLATAYF